MSVFYIGLGVIKRWHHYVWGLEVEGVRITGMKYKVGGTRNVVERCLSSHQFYERAPRRRMWTRVHITHAEANSETALLDETTYH